MNEKCLATGTTLLVRQEKNMKCFNFKARLIACLAIACFFGVMNSPAAQAQKPTSGALIKIDGTVGTTAVHLAIYDSQIHSGHLQVPPCASYTDLPTDAYVMQGGSWTGCDPGDDYEITDYPGEGPHQYAGNADLTGTGYSFHIETHYCGSSCLTISGPVPACNTAVTICSAEDSGYATITNTFGAPFTGTITLQGNSGISGGPYCPTNGVAFDSWTSGLPATNGAVTLALGAVGSVPDSSNCGGFNQPQTLTLSQGVTTKFKIGGDDFEITPTLGGTGDALTILPIPVPAGPLTGTAFGAESGLPALTGSRFSATNFPTQAIIPYADLSAAGNPVGLEFQITCAFNNVVNGNDCSTFLYTVQTDFTIDSLSFPGGIGGAHFLGQHEGTPVGYDGSCPTNGFNVDIFLSYTGGLGDPPLLGSSDGWSCFAGTFVPTAPAVPAGTTVQQQTFSGFDFPVSDKNLNPVVGGLTVPLIWRSLDSAGKPVNNLNLCSNFAGTGCTAPWVFVGTTPINCTTGQTLNSTITPSKSLANSGLINLWDGFYLFAWQTARGSTGCVTPVLKFNAGFVSIDAAKFKFF
jgi:hypothetical protein